MKKQVVVIGGGNAFETYEKYFDFLKNFEINIDRYRKAKVDWKPWLREKLTEKYDVFILEMPNKINAKYEEWKIWLDKFIPFLSDDVIMIGHSLGASFVVKYLSENKLQIKVGGAFIVSGVFDKDINGSSLVSFSLPEKLDLQTQNIFFYYSKDDPIIPASAIVNFKKLLPNAVTRVFEDRGHINQAEFPELLEDILTLR